MAASLEEQAQQYLLPGLTEEKISELRKRIKEFPALNGFYGSLPGEREPVQSDGWRGFIAADPQGNHVPVVGIVVSNSCDIAAANDPPPTASVLFAPILDVAAYAGLMRRTGKTDQQIESALEAIRQQADAGIFYLPGTQLFSEKLVRLDTIQSQPWSGARPPDVQHVFSLSNFGFYLFLIKLSLFFTRTGDQVARETLPEATGH